VEAEAVDAEAAPPARWLTRSKQSAHLEDIATCVRADSSRALGAAHALSLGKDGGKIAMQSAHVLSGFLCTLATYSKYSQNQQSPASCSGLVKPENQLSCNRFSRH
jgi:hypothetical protein